MVKVDIGPWRSSGNRIFSASLIGVPDLCFHDSSDCGLDRGGRWFLCHPCKAQTLLKRTSLPTPPKNNVRLSCGR
jgi:hypothetical protein